MEKHKVICNDRIRFKPIIYDIRYNIDCILIKKKSLEHDTMKKN